MPRLATDCAAPSRRPGAPARALRTAGVSAAVVCLCALAAPVDAQPIGIHASPGLCDGEADFTLPRSGDGDGASTTPIQILDHDDTVLACVDAGANDGWRSTRLEVGDESDWLELVVNDADRALYRYVDGGLIEVWSSAAPDDGEAHTDVAHIDLDGDGRRELVRHRVDPIAPPCGRDDLFIEPAVFDPTTGDFRDAVVLPPAANAPAVDVRPDGPADRYADDARVSVVSASARVGGWPSRDRGVFELGDDDPTTAWLEGRPGTGVGAWVRIDGEAGVPLAGVVVDNGDGGEIAGPTRWLVVFDDGRVHRATTPAHGRFALRFDPPVASSCVALVAAGLVDGATTFAVGGLSPRTALDALAPDAAIAAIAEVAATRLGDVRRGPTLALLARVADDAPDAALTAVDDAEGDLQRALVDALADVDATRPGLAERVATAGIDDDAARGWIARVPADDPVVRTALLARIAPGDPLALDAATALGTPTTDDETIALLDAYVAAPADEVEARLEALGAPNPLFLAPVLRRSNEGSASVRIRMERLALRLSHAPPAYLDAPVADILRANLAHDDGTVARLAIALAGRLRVGQLADDLAAIVADDPADELRLEAAAALAVIDADATVLDTLLDDPSPTLRLGALKRLDVVWPADRVAARLHDETWPDVRAALAAHAAHHPALVAEALSIAASDDEAVALLDALDTRPADADADAWLAAAERFGGSPRVLWRLVDRADGCTDPLLRPWLDDYAAQATDDAGAPPEVSNDAPPPPTNVYDRVHRAAARAIARCDAP